MVDDDPTAREWVRGIAESIGFRVTTYSTAMEFLDSYDSDQRGCLLLDVRLPRLSGLDLQSILRERKIQIPVVMMTAFGEVRIAVRAMRAGAFDFIEKPCSAQDLIDSINRAVDYDIRHHAEEAARAEARKRLSDLSERDLEILDGIMAGKANKSIAADLGVSEKAVEGRRARLMVKMEAQSLSELVRKTLLARG